MNEKKIEPTVAMVASAHSAAVGRLMTDPMTYRRILRAALNHPDARGLFTDENDRPWEPLNGRTPRVGDEVRQDLRGITRIAVVARLDGGGDPWAADGALIGLLRYGTWYVRRAAPPAEEVELPSEHPAHLTDVEDLGGDVCAYMALDDAGDWCGVSQRGRFCDWRPRNLTAFTLPDGTRARRDGTREDGTPRFVKVVEE